MTRALTGPSASRRRAMVEGLLFVSPWLFGFLTLTLGAMVFAIWTSFQKWNMIAPAEWVGLGNYRKAFTQDPLFWKSLGNTAYYSFVSVPLRVVVALLLAALLNQQVRGIAFFRTVFYLPSVVSGVATAMLWMLLLNPDVGGVNMLLRKAGVSNTPGWLTDPAWAMPGLILMSLWSVGTMMIIFLAALQGIPEELQEAARIDGAQTLHRFRHITLPLISPAILFNLVISVIAGFQVFMQSFVMTNGGPANATLTYVLYLYRNAFELYKMGYASALAWILFFIILAMTALILKSSPLWVHYEGERK